MTTNKSVTIYHHDGEEWHRQYFAKANVYFDNGASINKGNTAVANVKIRIPTTEDIGIYNGDKVIIGCCTAAEPPKGNDSHIVTHVIDNRRGSLNMHHWRVMCE